VSVRSLLVRVAALALLAPIAAPDSLERLAELSRSQLEAEVEVAITKGTAWIIANQREDGSWGSHHSPRPIEVFATPPGTRDAWRVATTALCTMALWDTKSPSDESAAAADRGLDYLIEHWKVRRVSPEEHYNVWSFGYALQCFGERLLSVPNDPRAPAIRAAAAGAVAKLGRYQDLDGGWGYLSFGTLKTYQPSFTSMSFTTATILVGLDRVARAGVEIPELMLGKALKSVRRCRVPRGTYSYGEIWNSGPMSGLSGFAGAACRVPLCQYALELFGDTFEEEDHLRGLRKLLVEEARYQVLGLRRPMPHSAWHQISGYFYLYGHAYAAYVLEERDEAVQRLFAPELARAVLLCREPDGSFWDYPLYSYHKPYGTAFSVMALSRLKF